MRNQIDIMLVMLNALREPKRITPLMFAVGTNWTCIKYHIEIAFKYKLIFRDAHFYHLNNRGYRFLELMERANIEIPD